MPSRRVQELRGSFYIYLPKNWCKKVGLKSGQELNLFESSDGAVTILPPGASLKGKAEIGFKIDDYDEKTIITLIVSSYISGARKLEIISAWPISIEMREKISKITRQLLGFEIVSETEKGIVINDVSLALTIKPLMKRELSAVKYMLLSIISLLESPNVKDAKIIVNRDKDVDRYHYAIERLSHLALKNPTYALEVGLATEDCLNYYMASKFVERTADHIVGIAKEIIKGRKIPEKLKAIAGEISSIYDGVLQAFFAKGIDFHKVISDILSQSPSIIDELDRTGEEAGERILTMHFRRIVNYCTDLAEIAIDQNVSRIMDEKGILEQE
ncbi:MAG: PhoU domain-containing protein [Promethearchaeota archaeon]